QNDVRTASPAVFLRQKIPFLDCNSWLDLTLSRMEGKQRLNRARCGSFGDAEGRTMATQKCFWSRAAGWCLTGFVALFAFSMSGCSDGFILSLQPFYVEADQEADSRLVGSWTDKEDGVTFVFEPGGGKEYEAVVKEMEDGRELSSNFEVHL